MAVPKRKVTRARRMIKDVPMFGKLDTPSIFRRPQCGELKTPHRVCGNCGYYKGREIIKKD